VSKQVPHSEQRASLWAPWRPDPLQTWHESLELLSVVVFSQTKRICF